MAEEVGYGLELNLEYLVPTWKHGKQGGLHAWSQVDRESRIEDLLG